MQKRMGLRELPTVRGAARKNRRRDTASSDDRAGGRGNGAHLPLAAVENRVANIRLNRVARGSRRNLWKGAEGNIYREISFLIGKTRKKSKRDKGAKPDARLNPRYSSQLGGKRAKWGRKV